MDEVKVDFDEEYTKTLAKELVDKVPVIYSTKINSSIARIIKIKFNENSKIQSFWNYFPELNHNEMEGYFKIIMSAHIIIFTSQFMHERNRKRIEVFKKLLEEKGVPITVIEMRGKNVFEELINAHYFADHVTYYLAEEYEVDPEPVNMVEVFKKLI